MTSIRRFYLIAVLFLTVATAVSQTNPMAQRQPDSPEDMQKLLSETAKNYREAKSIRIERSEVSIVHSELRELSDKSFSSVMLAPGGRYRREDKGATFWTIHISNGIKEWNWYPWRRQYVEETAHNTESEGSASAEVGWFGWLQQIDRKLAAGRVQAPQTIEIDGRKVDCMVITGPAAPNQRPNPSMKGETTYWIDRARKVLVKEEFGMRSSIPENRYSGVMTTTYKVNDLNASFQEFLFGFTPPEGTRRVDKFELEPVVLLGKPAPALKLKTVYGQDFDLSSLNGKAVIVDFWATWCMPCRESMPALSKLYTELKDRNLFIVSVSLDDDPEDARQYVAKYKFSWTNLVDPKRQSEEHWGTSGIPRLLLIGTDGTVLFESEGYDGVQEAKLREALHKMDPSLPPAKTAKKRALP
jgi:cytochrome c biogenesis protein CcmG, thiol:disulfide interchange protein DsbE